MIHVPPGLALDIDETLSITKLRIIELLHEKFGCPENLSPLELMEKYAHTSDISYWNEPSIHAWKLKLIESEELYNDVDLIENANHMVQKINSIVPISCYMTARPENTTNATRLWLQKHNFPIREIISKPLHVDYEDGNKWKANELMSRHPNIIGIVDDSPGLITALPTNYKGTVFLYSHTDYDNKTPIHVIPCNNWDTVYKKIISLHPQSQP